MKLHISRTSEESVSDIPGVVDDMIEISCLKELFALRQYSTLKGKELIIGIAGPDCGSKPIGPYVEIYDDYRE